MSKKSYIISILLVEDDIIIQKVMALLLKRLNCQVELAPNVQSAIAMAKKYSYELILLDIGLPDGNGDKVAAEIRHDENSPNQTTPIIAVTAHVDLKRKKECLLAGINAVLLKPLSEEVLREVINLFVILDPPL